MDKTADSNPMWVRVRDKARLRRLGDREHRRPVDQLTLIIDEALARRGLDIETCDIVQDAAGETK